MKETLSRNAQAVLDIVQATGEHPTALEIYDRVKQCCPRIGIATVYRILHMLVEQGYIKELGRNEEGSRYDGRVTRHDHALCTHCGVLLDLPVEITLPADVLQAAAQAAGIQLGSHEVRLYGLCPSCQALSAHV